MTCTFSCHTCKNNFETSVGRRVEPPVEWSGKQYRYVIHTYIQEGRINFCSDECLETYWRAQPVVTVTCEMCKNAKAVAFCTIDQTRVPLCSRECFRKHIRLFDFYKVKTYQPMYPDETTCSGCKKVYAPNHLMVALILNYYIQLANRRVYLCRKECSINVDTSKIFEEVSMAQSP